MRSYGSYSFKFFAYPILVVVRVGDGLLSPVVLGGLVGSGGLVLVGRHLGALSLTIMTDGELALPPAMIYVLSPLLRVEISVELILDSSALSNFFFFC